METAAIVFGALAGCAFLPGVVLFVVGLTRPAGQQRRAAAAGGQGTFTWLIKHAWAILFPSAGTTYPADQKMMAGGLMLMAIGGILALAAIGTGVAAAVGGSSPATPTPTPSSS